MKRNILFIFLFFLIFSNAIAANNNGKSVVNNNDEIKNTEDLNMLLDNIYKERIIYKQENDIVIKELQLLIDDIRYLVQNSKKEITQFTYRENRNLLIGTIFLWCSISMFIIMNIIFANSLKKELYFLRNILLRDEIKDGISNLSEQLKKTNQRLDAINRSK